MAAAVRAAMVVLLLGTTVTLAQQPTDRDRDWSERKYRKQQAALRVLGRLSYLPEPTLRSQKCDAAGVPQGASPMTAAALAAQETAEAVKKMSSSEQWAVSRMREKHHARHTRRHPVSTNGLLVSLARSHGLVFCKGCPDPHTDGSNIGEVWESHWIPEDYDVDGEMVYTVPNDAHVLPYNAEELKGNIAFTERGGVRFVEKARYVQEAGAVALVIVDNGGCERGSDFECAPLGSRAQGGWGSAELWSEWIDIYIPVVMLMPRQGDRLRALMELEYSELRGVGMQHIPQIKRLTPAQLDVADAAFNILDVGGDATVNRAEVRALLHEQLGHAVRVQHEHARRTIAADNPDIARLSDDRLAAVIARHVDNHATKLHRADSDDDGVLTRREFVRFSCSFGRACFAWSTRCLSAVYLRSGTSDAHHTKHISPRRLPPSSSDMLCTDILHSRSRLHSLAPLHPHSLAHSLTLSALRLHPGAPPHGGR